MESDTNGDNGMAKPDLHTERGGFHSVFELSVESGDSLESHTGSCFTDLCRPSDCTVG